MGTPSLQARTAEVVGCSPCPREQMPSCTPWLAIKLVTPAPIQGFKSQHGFVTIASDVRLLLPFLRLPSPPGFPGFQIFPARAGNLTRLQRPWGNLLLLLIITGHFKKNQMIKAGALPGTLT